MRLLSLFQSSKTSSHHSRLNNDRPGQGTLIQRLSLWSGLILMIYVLFHYINHALGNISLQAMDAMLEWQVWIWQSFPGTLLLVGSLLTHVILVVWKLVRRKTFRLPIWERLQIALGLAIPYFLATHIIAMRSPVEDIGIHINYSLALGLIWPYSGLAQSFLLLVTWLHGCIGMHFWLKLRPWYVKNLTWFAFIAALLPTLAMTGWINAARMNIIELQLLLNSDPEKVQEFKDTISFLITTILPKVDMGRNIIMGIGLAIIVIMTVYQISLRMKKRIKVDYGEGKVITSYPGNTILEISRQAGIPHMSVCGGRARCSTCRTLIIDGNENVQPKTDAESHLLDRLNAEDSIRLACQATVSGDIKLRPLVQVQGQTIAPQLNDPLGWGVEREIAILFLDIRKFSRISEKSLPYDIVFILNSFFGEVTAAIEQNEGYVDKFMGDGAMALFGLESDEKNASKNAIKAAIDCEEAARNVSRILTQHLEEPIKIGIGIHVGDAIIGRIGKTSDQDTPSRLTAIGDSVNISARLEQATKEFETALVISTKTAKTAGLDNIDELGIKTEITVRNISRPVEVLAVKDLKKMRNSVNMHMITS
ncbi:MAG: 2Fe-2S iron-sulfur cluster binding domain-containing protein [Hyphomicrobiales bacterium]|nr:2Fe-2S iron-sulfur cluster binding domain-containing protein [Hyphomicrobiales bacterium]